MVDLPFATSGTRPPRGYPGMPSDIGYKYDRSYSNNALDVAQISAITVGTYAAGATYTISINGLVAVHQAPASGGTATTVRNALIANINLLGAGVYAQVGGGANNLTITGQPGIAFSVSASATGGGAITASTTQPSVASGDIKLGLAVVQVAGDEANQARLGAPDADHRFLGVTIDNGFMRRGFSESIDSDACYRRQDIMTVREIGRCFVRISSAVTTQDKVYYFYDGANVGYFTPTSGTGADIEILNARWVENSSGEFAELYLGAPAILTASSGGG